MWRVENYQLIRAALKWEGGKVANRIRGDLDIPFRIKLVEVQIPLKEILPLAPYPPLFGNRSGKNNNTHWLCFTPVLPLERRKTLVK